MKREWWVIEEAREEAPALVPAVKTVSAFRGVVQKPWVGYDDEGKACFGFECKTAYPWSAVVGGKQEEPWRARVYPERVEVEQIRALPNTRVRKIVHRETMPLRRFVRTMERCSYVRKEI